MPAGNGGSAMCGASDGNRSEQPSLPGLGPTTLKLNSSSSLRLENACTHSQYQDEE